MVFHLISVYLCSFVDIGGQNSFLGAKYSCFLYECGFEELKIIEKII